MMADLAAIAPKLDPLIRRLATNHDGERLATVAALDRVLAAGGSSFHDLADCVVAGARPPRVIFVEREPPRPSPGRATWADMLMMARELDGNADLSPWEADFVAGVRRTLRRGYPLSAKQRRTLEKIWARFADEGAV
jgi:hypothetical protein